MTEEGIKEVVTSTPASPEPKCEDLLINSPVTGDGSSVPPDVKRKEKPVPHYLRASSRSCHDNCKYGIKHSSEPKKYWPVCRARLRRESTGNQERNRVEILLPQRTSPRKDQKLKIFRKQDGNAIAPAKSESVNLKAPLERVPDHTESTYCLEHVPAEASESVVAGTLPTDAEFFIISHDDVASCGDGESSDGAESIDLEMPLAIQDSDVSDEHIDDAILLSEDACEAGEQAPVDHVSVQLPNGRADSEMMTPKPVVASEKHEQLRHGTESKKSSANESVKPKTKSTVTSSITRNTASSAKSRGTSHPKATSTAIESSSGTKIMRKTLDATATTKFSNPERKLRLTVTSAVQKVSEIKASSPSKATDSSGKPARLEKLKVSTWRNAQSPSLFSGKQADRETKVKNAAKIAQVLQKKPSRSVDISAKCISVVKVRAVRKDKIAPPGKSSKKVSGTENSAADAKDAKEIILKTASEKVRKPDGRSRKEKPATPRTAATRRPKPASILPSSTGPAPSPRSMTFRRGKVLNPDEGGSSSTPRRIRFRPAMAAADGTLRSRGGRLTAGRRNGNAAGAKDSGASRAEVVVLRRRQDGKEAKKQEQVLLNNVIEETASRLVAEARKSKVKALVGAFETVISLQETGKAAAPAPAGVAT